MPAPSRHRRSPAPPPPPEPLLGIVQAHEEWRRSQNGKPGRGALRDYWRPRDQKHAQRPDYLLWRQTLCADSPPEKRQDNIDLALRVLRAPDAATLWAALSLLPGVLQTAHPRRDELIKAVQQRLPQLSPLPTQASHSCALIRWLCQSALPAEPELLLKSLSDLLLTTQSDWRLGRRVELSFLKAESWLPVSPVQITRWLLQALTSLVPKLTSKPDAAAWHLTAWMLLRDARPPQSSPRGAELEMLLNAACTARESGDPIEAARLTCLMMHLLPPQVPEAFLQRCRVAAWTLAEAGLTAPTALRVNLEDLPFPGEPATSEKGLESTRLFQDAADFSQQSLAQEVSTDPDWQRLREAGVVLHHPLAALAWIGKKAQSYVIKKQTELLSSATRLALRHHRLSTAGRLLAQWPGSWENVLDYAKALRQSQKRMPYLRDSAIWQDWTSSLRSAWGRLEANLPADSEDLFFLHETLLDREVTLLRHLPAEPRQLALRHLHSRRSPSALVQALEADPRLMQPLEHQRAVELWSIAASLRERPDQKGIVWVSLVSRGDPGSGRYSLLIQGSRSRVHLQGRLRPEANSGQLDLQPLLQELLSALPQVCSETEGLLLAVDAPLRDLPWAEQLWQQGFTGLVSRIPSWEWAFRVLRESASVPPALEILTADPQTSPTLPATSLPHGCLLLASLPVADADTRWTALPLPTSPEERPLLRRSLNIGVHGLLFSLTPLKPGDLRSDLTRLSLGQNTRVVISPTAALTEAQRSEFAELILNAPTNLTLKDSLRRLTQTQPCPWTLHGLLG